MSSEQDDPPEIGIDDIAQAQNWNSAELCVLLEEFIEKRGLKKDLVQFLLEVQAEENEEADKPIGG